MKKLMVAFLFATDTPMFLGQIILFYVWKFNAQHWFQYLSLGEKNNLKIN